MRVSKLVVFVLLLSSVACSQTATHKKEAAALADSAYRSIHGADRPKGLHKAIQFADKSIELDDSRSIAYELKSTALTLLQKPDLALEPLTAWLSKHPDESEFLVKRGLIYEKLGRSTEAEKDFDSI